MARIRRLIVLSASLTLAGTLPAQADSVVLPPLPVSVPTAAVAPDWNGLTPQQQVILQPLREDWNHFDAKRRLKWIGIANRYPKMSVTEQTRVQIRMKEWASLTPEQREKARKKFLEIQQASPEKRDVLREKWQAYENLPAEEKERLRAARAAAVPGTAGRSQRPPQPAAPPQFPAPPVVTPPTVPAQAPSNDATTVAPAAPLQPPAPIKP